MNPERIRSKETVPIDAEKSAPAFVEEHDHAFIKHLAHIDDTLLQQLFAEKAAQEGIDKETLVARAYANLSPEEQRQLMTADMGYLSGANKDSMAKLLAERLFPRTIH